MNPVLIVSRNNIHLTKKAVASAMKQDIDVSILLIDNASDDGTAAWASAQPIPHALHTVQRSLSHCWNQGLTFFFNQLGADHVLVTNNDIELRPDAYRLLLSHGGPFVTCVSVDDASRLGTPGDRMIESMPPRPHPDFSCFLIRKEAYRLVGPFNEAYYPAYAEDAEYHIRMHRAGVHAVCIDVPFLHHGASTIKHADEGEKQRIGRGAQKNRERFRAVYGCYPGTKEYEALFAQP